MMAIWRIHLALLLLDSLLGDICFISCMTTDTTTIQCDTASCWSSDVAAAIQDLEVAEFIVFSEMNATEVSYMANKIGRTINGLKIMGVFAPTVKALLPNVLPGQTLISAVRFLLEQFYEGLAGKPKHAMQNIVYEERVKQQENTLIGIRDMLHGIKAENIRDVVVARRSMETLRGILMTSRCQFMRRDNVRSSAAYFIEFATIHIVVIQMLILTDPLVDSWPKELQVFVKKYIAYAKYVAKEEAQHDRLDVWATFEPIISKWAEQLPADVQQEIRKSGAILEDEAVAFRLAPMSYTFLNLISLAWDRSHQNWLSCSNVCAYSTCSGTDNPMERGDGYKKYWKCRGEIFFLKGIDDNEGIIRACDRVGIFYGEHDDDYYWFGSGGISPNKDSWFISPCPGAYASSMRDGACKHEAWHIKIHGRKCGVAITDRDTVELVNAHTGQPLMERSFGFIEGLHPKFVVYRSSVDKDNYINSVTDCN